jgi:hypothetical protein
MVARHAGSDHGRIGKQRPVFSLSPVILPRVFDCPQRREKMGKISFINSNNATITMSAINLPYGFEQLYSQPAGRQSAQHGLKRSASRAKILLQSGICVNALRRVHRDTGYGLVVNRWREK